MRAGLYVYISYIGTQKVHYEEGERERKRTKGKRLAGGARDEAEKRVPEAERRSWPVGRTLTT